MNSGRYYFVLISYEISNHNLKIRSVVVHWQFIGGVVTGARSVVKILRDLHTDPLRFGFPSTAKE